MTTPISSAHASRFLWGLAGILLTSGAFATGRCWHDAPLSRDRVAAAPRLARGGFAPFQTPVRATHKKNNPLQSETRLRAAVATFSQVRNLVRDEYVDPLPSDTALSHGAAKAMLDALGDNQSRFLSPAERAVCEREGAGFFAGIGCVTAVRAVKTGAGYTEQQLCVVAPLAGSAAQKAGLRTGDRITHIDDEYILPAAPYLPPGKAAIADAPAGGGTVRRGIGLWAARMRLREGTTGILKLTVARRGEKEPRRFMVANTAGTLAAPQVRVQTVASGRTLILKMSGFFGGGIGDVADALRSVPDAASVVLDLRQNPGFGSFDTARRIAGLLAPSHRVFAVEIGASGRTPLPLPQTPPARATRPVAVLTDGGTAGLAEVLAAYLRDNGAFLVGSSTWGDGSSQTLYPLPDGSGFSLTTGRLVSPRGMGWNGTGLVPRFVLPKGLTEAEIVTRAAGIARASRGVVAHGRRSPEARP